MNAHARRRLSSPEDPTGLLAELALAGTQDLWKWFEAPEASKAPLPVQPGCIPKRSKQDTPESRT